MPEWSRIEQDYLRLLADGAGREEAIRRLGVSEHTTKLIRRRIMQKLGVETTEALLARYAANRQAC